MGEELSDVEDYNGDKDKDDKDNEYESHSMALELYNQDSQSGSQDSDMIPNQQTSYYIVNNGPPPL